MSYGGEMMKWVVEKMAVIGDWFSQIPHQVMHDPVWTGAAIVLASLVIGLAVLRWRAGRS
jgi:hypothetical protein